MRRIGWLWMAGVLASCGVEPVLDVETDPCGPLGYQVAWPDLFWESVVWEVDDELLAEPALIPLSPTAEIRATSALFDLARHEVPREPWELKVTMDVSGGWYPAETWCVFGSVCWRQVVVFVFPGDTEANMTLELDGEQSPDPSVQLWLRSSHPELTDVGLPTYFDAWGSGSVTVAQTGELFVFDYDLEFADAQRRRHIAGSMEVRASSGCSYGFY